MLELASHARVQRFATAQTNQRAVDDIVRWAQQVIVKRDWKERTNHRLERMIIDLLGEAKAVHAASALRWVQKNTAIAGILGARKPFARTFRARFECAVKPINMRGVEMNFQILDARAHPFQIDQIDIDAVLATTVKTKIALEAMREISFRENRRVDFVDHRRAVNTRIGFS